MELPMRTLKRLLLTASMCCLVATASAGPFDDADAAHDRGDYAQELKILRPLATKGNADAQYGMGALYYEGKGVTKDYKEAVKWLRLAATQGYASAQYRLGGMYFFGHGVAQNDQEALKWWRLAADQGDEQAIFSLKANGLVERVVAAPPDRRSTILKEEQVSIKTNQKTEQPRRITARAETPERASPPKLIFKSSAPKSDGTVELSGRVISDASISEILINGRALEVSLGRDNSFTVTRGLPMGAVTSYRLSVMDEYGQKAETEINVERAAIQYAEQVAPLNPRKLKAQTNPNAVALIIGIEAYSRLPQAQYALSTSECIIT